MENKLYVMILCGMELKSSKCHDEFCVFDFVDIRYFVTCSEPSGNSMMVWHLTKFDYSNSVDYIALVIPFCFNVLGSSNDNFVLSIFHNYYFLVFNGS